MLSSKKSSTGNKVCSLLGGIALASIASQANAGGFDYFQSDYSLLFTPSNAVEFGATYVAPERSRKNTVRQNALVPSANPLGFAVVDANDGGDGGNFAHDFGLPTFSVKYSLNDNLGCMGSLRYPYGTHQDAGQTWAGRYYAVETDMTNRSYNLDCMYSFDAGDARIGIIAGVRSESSSVILSQMASSAALTAGRGLPGGNPFLPGNPIVGGPDSLVTLDATSREYGYTLGASLDLPEYGFKMHAIYQSEIEHNYSGTQTIDATNLLGATIVTDATAKLVTSPQSIQVNASKQLDDGWGVIGFVRWVDWSKVQNLDVFTNGGSSLSVTTVNWKDGWTYGGGVTKLVSPKLALYGVLSYDIDTSNDTTRGPRSGTFDSFTGTLGATIAVNQNSYLKLSGSYKRALGHETLGYGPTTTDGQADPAAGSALVTENDDSDIWVGKAVFGFTF